LSLASGTTVNIPAGAGVIVPPGDTGAALAESVSWESQVVTLTYLNTSFSTELAIDKFGAVTQFAGRAPASAERNYIILGVVNHVGGTATSVKTVPAIFGDNGYLNIDTAAVLSSNLVSGGGVSRNATGALQLDVADGTIALPGARYAQADRPNGLDIVGQAAISFKALAGSNVVGTSINNAPVANYDPNGSGVVTALPQNGDATIHRLYYLFGEYIWVYGQIVYSTRDAALLNIDVDRSKYKPSSYLNGATMLAEIVATKTTTDLNAATAAIVAYGGNNPGVGSAGGITDAPADGTTYGRLNGTWAPTVSGNNPQITGDVIVTKLAPKVILNNSPTGAGTSGLRVRKAGTDWATYDVVDPDDKAYFKSFNPTGGALRNTTTWDLATGDWTFPTNVQALTFNGNPTQTSATDVTANALMRVGAFGLGTGQLEVSDVNDINESGFYSSAMTAPGNPTPDSNFGYTIVNGPLGWFQIANKNLTLSQELYVRTWGGEANGNVYSQWRQIALTNSPAFTGVPTAPTAAGDQQTTQIATCAFTHTIANFYADAALSSARTVPVSTTISTLVVGDKGKCVSLSAGITVPASVFAAGDVVSVYNNTAGNLTITQASGLTLRQVGTANTGNRTLAQRGMATIWFVSATEAVISGGGLS